MDSAPGDKIPRGNLGGFREALIRGAVDMARVAAREIDDPHVWAVLDRLAQQYQLAGDDD